MKYNRYLGHTAFAHGKELKVGILLTNLGTPDAPTASALRPYLREFLADPRVIELPRATWLAILHLFILPFRPRKSAALYKQVWTEEGSPLLVNTRRQQQAFEQILRNRVGNSVAVEIGMRYGNPSIADALDRLRAQNIDRLFVLPLFPQYSATTSAPIFDAATAALQNWRWVPDFRILMKFHDHPGYIRSLVESVEEFWRTDGKPEKLLFSFHGIPKRYFDNGDPYHCHCHKTARLVAEGLGLKKEEYVVCFQSLFGREEWLRPYTSDTVEALAKSGLKSLDVICPGFAADCLETIEEIDGQNREIFEHASGGRFRYIPALNDRHSFIETLVDITLDQCHPWLVAKREWNEAEERAKNEATAARFHAMNS